MEGKRNGGGGRKRGRTKGMREGMNEGRKESVGGRRIDGGPRDS